MFLLSLTVAGRGLTFIIDKSQRSFVFVDVPYSKLGLVFKTAGGTLLVERTAWALA